jgi:hypothetical protein
MYDFTTMHKSVTKAVTLVLTIFCAVSFSGCGSTSSTSTTPPPQSSSLTISNIIANSITATGATITWSTSANATSQVDYGTSANYGSTTTFDSNMVTSHSVSLTGLTANTVYNVRVRSKDASGAEFFGTNFSFTTTNSGSSSSPPQISAVNAAASLNGASITWMTDKPADQQVDYGTTTAYGSSSALGTSLSTSHSITLTGLSSATTYNYRVKSRDSAGNLTTSNNSTFRTLATPDTTPPTVSITTPTSGANVSGTVNLTASASDNVAVAGVQFLVDGQPVGGEQTAAPYSFAWNSATVGNGSHTVSATARDGSGNRTTSAAIGVNVSNTVAASDFQKRCQSAGVLRCWDFDDPAATDAHVIPPFGSTVKQGQVVTDVVSSGTGSLRFTVPSQTGADTSGSFSLDFADDFSQQFGEGQEFYLQYRIRYNDVMVNTHFTNSNGFKMSITGEGDRPGTSVSSCTTLELPLENSGQQGFPQGYHSCGLFQPLQVSIPNTFEFLDQNAAGCPHYGNQGFAQSEPPCFKYKANEWITMQQHVKIGHWGQNDSTVEVWAADQGQTSRLIISLADYDLRNDNPSQAKYGKIWLLPYQTNKDSSQVTGTGYVWYDDLIVSTNRIPDPDVATPNAPDLLRAAAGSTTKTIQLSWRDNSGGTEQGFTIERCSDLANTCMATQSMFTTIATVGPNVTSYQDTGLISGQHYTYRVTAFNTAGDSAYSGGACFNGGNPCYSQASPN